MLLPFPSMTALDPIFRESFQPKEQEEEEDRGTGGGWKEEGESE